jgi:hypothetical protein
MLNFVVVALAILLAALLAAAAFAGLVAVSRRLDRVQRRQAYETECIVKSLQALEQQNRMLSDRLNSVIDAGQKLASDLERANRQAEETPLPLRDPNRLLH